MVSRYKGSGRHREGGFAAVHRQDFHAHTTGGDWRHKADQLDMNPPISTFNNLLNSPTVQGTLEKMASLIDTVGQGFITIGDGYNLGDYNVDSGTTLQDAFVQAFANDRLQNGGIVLVKSGTYRLTATVQVPAGITIMGEPAGTYIFGSMNEQPMFRCAASNKLFQFGSILGNSFNVENTTDRIMFWNIVLGDNLDGYSRDSGHAIATMSTVPMIQMVHGANVILDQVTMLGRITNSFPPLTVTKRAVGLDSTTSAGAKPTTLWVKNCYIDSMSQGIYFDVRNGRVDHLRVQDCRIRTYGGATTEESSAATFNLCNLVFSGNHHIGGGFGAVACLYLRNDTVNDSNDVRINIVNNSGGQYGTGFSSSDLDNFYINASSYSAKGVISGNSWGENNNSPWFITVGDGTSSIGDITGPSSLDVVSAISAYSSSLSYHTDVFVIVGYGTYTMTSGGTSGRMNLLGKPRNNVLPTIQLNSGTGTDEASNPTTAFGHHIENIHFKTRGATSYNTARLNGGYSTAASHKKFNVKNCEFEDAGLIAQAPSRIDNFENITYTLEACHFFQTGAFANNFCFLLPQTADHIYLRDVSAITYGYVGGIGDVSGVYTSMAPVESNITLEGCLFRARYLINGQGANSITAASPLTGMNAFFFVNSSRARLFVDNCTISCADANSTVGATNIIGGGLPAAGTFQRYVQLQAKDIIMRDSLVLGPNQRYTSGGTDYSMPAVWVEPAHMIDVSGCKLKGSCALQVSGTGQFTDVTESAGIFISGSEIKGFPGGGSTSTTALDIDARIFVAGAEKIFPKLVISNCIIDNKFGSTNTNATVQHVVNIGTDYYGIGVAQIYAQGWSVKIADCAIDGKLGTNLPTGISVLGGLVIDTLGSLVATLDDGFITVSNSSIKLFCDLDVGSLVYAVTGWFAGVRLQIQGNTFHYRVTTVGAGSNMRGYAFLRTLLSRDDGSIVSDNTFGRTGGGNLNVAAIALASLSGQGAIVDNDFDDPTLDGTSTALFSDTITPPWRKERNRNQTATMAFTANCGVQTVGGTSLGFTGTNNDFKPSTIPTGTMDYVVQVAGSGAQAEWAIDLNSALPPNVYIISATADISFAGGTAGGNHFLELQSATHADASSAVTPPGGTMTVTATSPLTNYRTNSSSHPIVYVLYNTSAAGTAVTATVTPIVVTFRW